MELRDHVIQRGALVVAHILYSGWLRIEGEVVGTVRAEPGRGGRLVVGRDARVRERGLARCGCHHVVIVAGAGLEHQRGGQQHTGVAHQRAPGLQQQLAVAVDRLVDTFEVRQDKLMPLPPNLSEGIQRIATSVHAGEEQLTIMASAARIYETVRASAAATGAGAA
jgi:hypothetical protein